MTFHMRAGKVVQRRRDEVAAFSREFQRHQGEEKLHRLEHSDRINSLASSYFSSRLVVTAFSFALRSRSVYSHSLSFNVVPVRLLETHQFRGGTPCSLQVPSDSASVAKYEEAAKIDLHRKIRLRIPENLLSKVVKVSECRKNNICDKYVDLHVIFIKLRYFSSFHIILCLILNSSIHITNILLINCTCLILRDKRRIHFMRFFFSLSI